MTEWLKLQKANCKNCYKCIRHCPVKSIRITGNQAHIVESECILCGGCFVVCPQNAKQITSSLEIVKTLIQSNEKVVASIAPSFIANFENIGIESLKEALLQLGFYDVEETAIGATIVKKEYETILLDEKPNLMISSCCHSVNLLIQKHFPHLLKYLADVVSPMQAHSLDIKKRIKGAKTVFIGPCVAKKDEAERYEGVVDAVLTFEELSIWLKENKIVLKEAISKNENSKARLFPIDGGILQTMEKNPQYTYLSIDGVEKCIDALNDISSGKLHNCFIEMSSCAGSCICGPIMSKNHHSPIKDYLAITNYAGNLDFVTEKLEESKVRKTREEIFTNALVPTENEISAILKKMGKFKAEDELNCGCCGYSTCRNKAIGIFNGKADYSMCLPFLKDRAESFSDNIINNTPNGIIVINENLEIQQINNSAKRILNIRDNSDVLGGPVSRVIDVQPFIDVQATGKNIKDQKVYLSEYNRYVEQSVILDSEYNILICLMRDVTASEEDDIKKALLQNQTIEIANKVVDKQMRIVQEIAFLLGETAAETKVALTKLKEAIIDE